MLISELKNTFIWLGLLIWVLPVLGQTYQMTRYADDNGLPSRMVSDVDQDPNGFLWVAGNNGLYKFDGQEFKGYYAVLNDTTGLRENKINTVLAATDGRVWIATSKGLHVLKNEVITYVELLGNPNDSQNYIIHLFEDSNQNIWVGTYGGVFVIEHATGNIRYLSKKGSELHEESIIWGISEDNNGHIWVCRSWEPPLLIKKGGYDFKELSFVFEDDLGKKNINPFKYIQYDNNTFLVNAGVGLLKGIMKNDSTLIVGKFRNTKGEVVGGEFIYNSIIDKDRNIWTATWKNKFKKYRLNNGYLNEEEVISTNGLLGMQTHVRSVYEDVQKNIWLANTNGLYKLTRDSRNSILFPSNRIKDCIESLNVSAIAEDNGGHIWVTTTSDLYRFEKSDILQGTCPKGFIRIKNQDFIKGHTLFIDSQNRLWVGAEGGLFVTQLNNDYTPGKWWHYTEKDGLPHNWSFAVLEEDKNNFWVGNYVRLVKLSFPEGNMNHPQIKTYNSNKERTDALVNSYTIELEKDQEDKLWVGTFHGLSRLVSEEGEGVFENYLSDFSSANTLSNDAIKNIYRDSQNRLWIGTQTGLNLYDAKNNSFKRLGRKAGLPSEYILGIQEDSKGFLWIATTNGLIKTQYDEANGNFAKIQHYTSQNGLADNITNKNALYIDADDHVFIGNSKGINVIGPAATAKETMPFNLAITGIESTQKDSQTFSRITQELEHNTLELSHLENSIRIKYAALDFSDPNYNAYRHKFLPLHDNWIETQNNAQLAYYNLSPGSYELILDGSGADGRWSKSPIVLKLIIHPPFWKSNWVFAIYTLLATAILRFFYVLRIRKKVRQLEQQTLLERALVKEREQLRQENAADFHDELGSQVTKISLFLTLAERSLKEHTDPRPWFEKMHDNIKALSGGFRDLLWVIDPQKDSLGDTFLRLKDFGEELFEGNGVDFRTAGYLIDHQTIVLDPQTKKQVVMIFKEAMTNCIKYAESRKANLAIKSNGKYFGITLKDNGIGFNVEAKSKGRGLKNMNIRAKKINAHLDISSNKEGTVVRLNRIPHSSDVYSLHDV